MKPIFFLFVILVFLCAWQPKVRTEPVQLGSLPYKLYPDVNENQPDLSSPFLADDGGNYIIAVTKTNKYAIFPVSPQTDQQKNRQLVVDTTDFPILAQTGLHSENELANIKMITGRSLAEITDLGRPGQLSGAGFMRAEEDILSILKADNTIVQRLGLTHPQLATPLFQILNMMDIDLKLNRWNMAQHEWQNIRYIFYNSQKVYVEAHDTKGGQLSIFDDGIEGAFWMVIKRELSASEENFLKQHYNFLTTSQFDTLRTTLTFLQTGEMEPQYIQRYGFYEGHTEWRTDPITLALIFNLKSLSDIESTFPGQLYTILTTDFRRLEMCGEQL